jgi:O-succinylbenzoate synthase
VYTLEKVLRVKKDAITHVEFLEEVMKTLDEKPSFTFWTTLAKAFESQTKQAAHCENSFTQLRSQLMCSCFVASASAQHGISQTAAVVP